MTAKPILIYKLTPAQIGLLDRLASSENGVPMDRLEYGELIAYDELAKLGFADMRVERRKRISIVITDQGSQVRAAGYLSKKPVIRLTEPQVAALRFLAGGRRRFNDIPAHMKDTCRRMALRGWAVNEEEGRGQFSTRITTEGWQVLKLVDM